MSRLHPAVQAAIAASLALILALVSVKAWRLSLDVPFEHWWDSLYEQALVKSILDNGWHLTNDDLGAPFGAQLYDFPQGADNLHFLIIKLLGLFSGDSAVVMNLFWLLTFPLTAVAAWWAFRSLGLPALPAIVCAVLFALLPYHFWRGEGHLRLSAYYVVPLACVLILRVLQRERLFPFVASGRRGLRARLLDRRLLGPVAVCVVIGSGGPYYIVFTVLLLIGAALLVAWDGSGRRPAIHAAVAVALIAATAVLNLMPSIVYRASHSENDAVAERTPQENELYALTLIGMLLPATAHRAEPLENIKANYLASTMTPNESAQSLGLIGAVGLVALFVIAGRAALRPFSTRDPPLLRAAAVAAVMAFVLGTFGGVSDILARAIDPQIRAWNRISVFIGFFALLAVGYGLAWLYARLERRSRGSLAVVGASAAILVFGMWDQGPPAHAGQFDPDYVEPQYASDEAFVGLLERKLPEGASVLQLPYLRYPEGYSLPEGYSPPGQMNDYDPIRGYLHSKDLRWSYGAMKGRSADVTACFADAPIPQVVPVAGAVGFDAIWLDRFGYADSSAVEAGLYRATSAAPWESPNARFVAYDLARSEARAPLAERVAAVLPMSGDDPQDCGWADELFSPSKDPRKRGP